jgi:putative spermidine/putrescine transport system substrate-binding protein
MKNLFLLLLLFFLFSGCGDHGKNKELTKFNSWDEILEKGRNTEVTILMWGGNESVNNYMDRYVSENVMEKYGITLKRVPMNAPEYMSKLINEKKAGLYDGTASILWINGENFKTAKRAKLIWGPFTDLLPNFNKYYDKNSSDLKYDTGISIEGYEAIWGKAQLVFTYDSDYIENPPGSYKELLEWARENPGKFTYPRLPDDFAGTAFVRTAYYELTGERDFFQKEITEEEFREISKPVVCYFRELNKYLWREGKAFPVTQAQEDEFFKNGELYITMGFETGKTSGLIEKGIYPRTVKTFIFDSGTIGNSHYLAIPFNAPSKGGALLVIDFLQSPAAQMEKSKPSVWGDMPAFDISKLSDKDQEKLSFIEKGPAMLSVEELSRNRLPEMRAEYIEWIKKIWVEEIGGK